MNDREMDAADREIDRVSEDLNAAIKRTREQRARAELAEAGVERLRAELAGEREARAALSAPHTVALRQATEELACAGCRGPVERPDLCDACALKLEAALGPGELDRIALARAQAIEACAALLEADADGADAELRMVPPSSHRRDVVAERAATDRRMAAVLRASGKAGA